MNLKKTGLRNKTLREKKEREEEKEKHRVKEREKLLIISIG